MRAQLRMNMQWMIATKMITHQRAMFKKIRMKNKLTLKISKEFTTMTKRKSIKTLTLVVTLSILIYANDCFI